MLGLPSMGASGLLPLPKCTLGVSSLEEDDTVEEVEFEIACLMGVWAEQRMLRLNLSTVPGSSTLPISCCTASWRLSFSSFPAPLELGLVTPALGGLTSGPLPARPNVSKLVLEVAPPASPPVPKSLSLEIVDNLTAAGSGSYSSGWKDHVERPLSGTEGWSVVEVEVDQRRNDFSGSIGTLVLVEVGG